MGGGVCLVEWVGGTLAVGGKIETLPEATQRFSQGDCGKRCALAYWPNADSGGTDTNGGCVRMRPGCVPDASRMRRDASGCVRMRQDFEFRQNSSDFRHKNSAVFDFRRRIRRIPAKFRQHFGKFGQNLGTFR